MKAIILAAGSGTRLAQVLDKPKQFISWQGLPLYWHSAKAFSLCPKIDGLIFVFPEEHLKEQEKEIENLEANHGLGLPYHVICGGTRRQDSVMNALEFLRSNFKANERNNILIHDSARAFIKAKLINDVIEKLESGVKGVIPALKLKDTVKIAENDKIVKTLERDKLVTVQTPQGFEFESLYLAHKKSIRYKWEVTDDAALLEKCRDEVQLIQGDEDNIKITNPEDLKMLSQNKKEISISSFGYDVHKYTMHDEAKARNMKLGGVEIANAPKIIAHSDGDVLLHALSDAMLGLACAPDIGALFPDNDEKNDNMNSAIIVAKALQILDENSIRLSHVDLSIIAQKPKIAPHILPIRKNIANLLQINENMVSLKATTEEGLGFTGELLGIKAVALVSAIKLCD